MLTPMDIQNKDFKRATIRGYREDEVEEFLDRVAADYERLYRENEKLKEQANLNEKEIAQFRRLEKNLQDTLMVAQKTAEEVISSAKKNAEEMKKNALNECQNIREQAQIDARRHMNEANNKLRNINAEYDQILREKNAFLVKIRAALETELAVTVQLLNSTPSPKEIIPTTSSANSNTTNTVPDPEPNEPITKVDPEAIIKSAAETRSNVDSALSTIPINPVTSEMPITKISIDK